MIVELTPRSAEIIAREQAEHRAPSPEQLIEHALEAYSGTIAEPSWFHAGDEECRRMIEAGLDDLRQGRVHSAEEVLREMDRIATSK